LDTDEDLAALARVLRQLLLASYGMYPDDLAAEVADACRHLGASEVVVLLVDHDQDLLVAFAEGDDRTYMVDDPGPGDAFREERIVVEPAGRGSRRLWVHIIDSAERVGVLGIVDGGRVPPELWEPVASLVGELVMSKADYGDHIERRTRRRAFTLPAEMRWGLLPPLTFTGPHVSVAGLVHPTHGIAGDAFDYAITDRTLSVAVFDAMGHGLEASRMASLAVAANRQARRNLSTPAEILRAIDEVVASEFGEGRFITAQTAALDIDSGALAIANAGHPRPLLVRSHGPAEEIACPPAYPAGIGTSPSSITVELQPGDKVLFFTDGIAESRSPAGQFFGDDRLASMVDELCGSGLPIAEVLRQSMGRLIAHRGDRPGDDATLVLVHWTGAP
jgi:hypothetical protein